MADQLSLRLEPILPHLPAELRPMLPRPAAAPFDSAAHLFEPNWSGRRALAFLQPQARGAERLRVLDDGGRDLAPLVPELANLPARLRGASAILDGELVVVDRHGRADHAALRTRLAGPRPTIGRPIALLAFDVLYLDGRPLLAVPLERRRRLLAEILMPGHEVVAVPAIATEGRALHEAVVAQGIAGVMARERRSPYLPGTRSGLWLFVERAAVEPERGDAVEADPGTEADERTTGDEGHRAVLALIRRLPLEDG